jgi:hypothetical protein
VEIRQWVADQLKPFVEPRGWLFVRYSTSLSKLSRPVAMLKLQALRRTPEAPGSGHTVEFVLTLIDPAIDPEKREDSLDENLIELVYALDTIPNVRWTNAQRVMFDDKNLAFDITLEVLTSKDKETP